MTSPGHVWRQYSAKGDGRNESGLVATQTGKIETVIPGSRLLRAVAPAVLALVLATACNPTAPLTQGPRLAKDQTLHVLLDDSPGTLDPGQTQYPYETAVLRAISEPLLKPTADLSGVVPAAAQSYDVAAGGTVFVFHLRVAAADRPAPCRARRDFLRRDDPQRRQGVHPRPPA